MVGYIKKNIFLSVWILVLEASEELLLKDGFLWGQSYEHRRDTEENI